MKRLITALLGEPQRSRMWHDMALVYRNHWEGDKFSKVLEDAELPYTEAKNSGKVNLFKKDSVKLLTMHSSKGLEFPFVAIPCLGTMPKPDEDESDEARLLYVAMTRATEELLLTYHEESAFTQRIRASIDEIQGRFTRAVQGIRPTTPPATNDDYAHALREN